ncbi:TPA: hypothetical protein ENS27_05710 [bacterium]|nr:hypothetical protein [bacterium]
MKLGISSYTYTWGVGVQGHYPQKRLSVMDLIDKAIESDIHVVQIADNLPLHNLSNIEIESLAKFSSGLNITIEVGTRGILNNNLLTYLSIAKKLNSSIVRVVIDGIDHYPNEDEIIDIIKPQMIEFEKAKISLAIENHDRFTTKSLKRIIQRIDSEYAGICLDCANSFGAMEGPDIVFDELGPFAVNIHIKGFKIYRAYQNMGFIIEGVPIDKSMLDISWILNKVKQFKKDTNIILEQWTPFGDNIEETIEKEENWVKTSIEYMRKFVKE